MALNFAYHFPALLGCRHIRCIYFERVLDIRTKLNRFHEICTAPDCVHLSTLLQLRALESATPTSASAPARIRVRARCQ